MRPSRGWQTCVVASTPPTIGATCSVAATSETAVADDAAAWTKDHTPRPSPISERYPVGTVLHGLELVAYVRKHAGGRTGGIHAWHRPLRCHDCGAEVHMRMHRWVQDKDVCRCHLRPTTKEGSQNG